MAKPASSGLPLLAMMAAMLPSIAYAHADPAQVGGFLHGLAHPVGGLDHLCVMLAIGMWAAQTGGRAVWVVPMTFIGMMAVGGAMPVLGINLPFVEHGIVLSVLLSGLLIAASVRLPLWLVSPVIGLFALWHGYVHDAEMPALDSRVGYAPGFLLATLLLHVIGIVFSLNMQRLAREPAIHAAGASIMLYGIYLSAG